MQIYGCVITVCFLRKTSSKIALFCTFVASFLIQRKRRLGGNS